jgi:hypothetical protein
MSRTQGIIPGGSWLDWGVPAREATISGWARGSFLAGMVRDNGSIDMYEDAVGYGAALCGRETLATAGDTPNGLKVERGVLGLVSWELGLVRGPGLELVLRECRLGVECVECSGVSVGG